MSASMNVLSAAGRRLYWTLQGPLPLASSVVSVMPENLNPDAPHEPYYLGQTPADAGTAEAWHPISQEPITERPVASLSVMEANLKHWRDGWYDTYIEPNDDLYPSDQEEFEGMPPKFDPVVVTASNGQFVTIHDYLSTVHPWLVERRLLILRSRYELIDDNKVVTGDERILVFADPPNSLDADLEDEGLRGLRWSFEREQQRRQQQQQQMTG
ncbi:hypothetical protein RB597_003468 [Gaeumannomyces tritici]